MLDFMYITNNPDVAQIVQNCGVKRVWIDLEKLGKAERQANINSVKSDHSIEDIKRLRPYIVESDLLVRVNPININSRKEINQVINNGADIVMLPMFKTLVEVEKFIKYVDKKVKTVLLFETIEAVDNIDKILTNYKGYIDEVHVGLNDLHLAYGNRFMFELLSNGKVEKICKTLSKYEIPYGFGGVAKIGEGLIPAEKIIAEHYRLGSSRVILSRSFCDNIMEHGKEILWEKEFSEGVKQIRKFEDSLLDKNESFFKKNIEEIKNLVNLVSNKLR